MVDVWFLCVHVFVGYGLVYLCVLCICLRPCGELWGVSDGVRRVGILVINWHMWEPEISKSFVLSLFL